VIRYAGIDECSFYLNIEAILLSWPLLRPCWLVTVSFKSIHPTSFHNNNIDFFGAANSSASRGHSVWSSIHQWKTEF